MANLRRDLPTYKLQGTWKKILKRIAIFLCLLYLAMTIISGVFLRTRQEKGQSMAPSINPLDRVIISPLAYGKLLPFGDQAVLDFTSPRRGDLVEVQPPYTREHGGLAKLFGSLLGFLTLGLVEVDVNPDRPWESNTLVRRVIAVAGDSVFYTAGVFMVRPAEDEVYHQEQDLAGKTWSTQLPGILNLEQDAFFSDQTSPLTVPVGTVFLGADNRSGFLDSRHWGCVPLTRLRGRVLARYWPWGKIGSLP